VGVGVGADERERARRALRDEALWHDLECSAYRADVPLWHELAERHGDRILEIGAGTGRVALELARAGHSVTALERDTSLVQALRRRAAGMPVEVTEGDARALELAHRDFSLCIVAMQTIQLFGGAGGRAAFLGRARLHLRAGGVLACAILGPIQPFDCAGGEPGPAPEAAQADGLLCVSVPMRVRARRRGVVIERERRVFPGERDERPGASDSDRALARERCVVELDRVSEHSLRREGATAGLRPLPSVTLAATEDHVGSTVVILGA
jgi:SAM-dependent methyltransferase